MVNLNVIEIDGSFGSAGGQILRTAAALSVITKKPCHIINIRRGRPKPGLMSQHLLGIQALAQLCNGSLEGDELGSEEIKFYPGETKTKNLHLKIETAGSITLCLQSLLPAAFFLPEPIKISFNGGGTDVPFSPTIDHFRYVFLKILEKMGAKVEIEILKRGYFPVGGGRVMVKVFPSKWKTINLIERGNLKKLLAISRASDSLKNKKVAERQLMGMREILGKLKLPIEERVEYTQTDCPGSSICLICQFENTTLGVDGLGKIGKQSEQVGKETAMMLLEEEKSQACLDRFLADQVLIYMALSGGKSQVKVSKITPHVQTNIWVISKFLGENFKIKDNLIIWGPPK